MNVKELKKMLENSLGSNRGKYIPWWTCEFDREMYRYNIFTEEEVQDVEACLSECSKDDIASTDCSWGLSLFHLLVWHNFYNAVENMFGEGGLALDVNIVDSRGKELTPFLLACSRGNYAMAKLLADHGADVAHCDAAGKNAYHFLVRPYIEGFSSGYECQRYSMDQRAQIADLIGNGINAKNAAGLTPLQLLLDGENASYSWALTDVFLKKGADISCVDEKGNTLLMKAIQKGHLTAALRLAESGAMINTPNADGKTPMQAAKDMYNEGLCIAIKDYGAEEPCDVSMDINNLSRLTSNAFAGFSNDEKDKLSLALYLAKKLIAKLDPDDDDDMECLTNIMYSALLNDDKCQVLDFCKEADIDFTMPIHSGGSVFCIRDKCLGGNYGVKTIKKFIELGVDMDMAVIQGKTPANIVASQEPRHMMFRREKDDYFEKAAMFFSKESMEQLDNSGVSAVHQAAQRGHLEMLKVMIEKGVDVNVTQDAPAEAGNTPLHCACMYGHGDIVKLLEESGADSALQNIKGELPAHYAVMKKQFGGDLESKARASVLKELKTLDGARNDGVTPLMLLQFLGINTVIDLLPIFLERGVNVNATDNRGRTALIFQTENMCFKDIVKGLVKAGADINVSDNQGNTALYYALRYGNQEVARFLIKKGADYNHTNNKGESPVQIAVEKGYDTVLELMTDIQ